MHKYRTLILTSDAYTATYRRLPQSSYLQQQQYPQHKLPPTVLHGNKVYISTLISE